MTVVMVSAKTVIYRVNDKNGDSSFSLVHENRVVRRGDRSWDGDRCNSADTMDSKTTAALYVKYGDDCCACDS